jgi:hypothetical protein
LDPGNEELYLTWERTNSPIEVPKGGKQGANTTQRGELKKLTSRKSVNKQFSKKFMFLNTVLSIILQLATTTI